MCLTDGYYAHQDSPEPPEDFVHLVAIWGLRQALDDQGFWQRLGEELSGESP